LVLDLGPWIQVYVDVPKSAGPSGVTRSEHSGAANSMTTQQQPTHAPMPSRTDSVTGARRVPLPIDQAPAVTGT
jgi:hypothetical protein